MLYIFPHHQGLDTAFSFVLVSVDAVLFNIEFPRFRHFGSVVAFQGPHPIDLTSPFACPPVVLRGPINFPHLSPEPFRLDTCRLESDFATGRVRQR